MISVLICSANKQLLNQVRGNIEETIGCAVEILFYDNRTSKKGICEVYNSLASKATYPFLCFLHEDVLFTTKDWDKKLTEIFLSRSEIGVVGIAGSKYKSAAYSGWFTGIKSFDCANYIHSGGNGNKKVYLNPSDNKLEEVVCLDGVFICCRKEIWQQVRFNEKELTGFHFYDISFTLEAARHCSIVVTYEIDLLHITQGGDFGNKWVETGINYHQSIRHLLPFSKLPSVEAEVEKKIMSNWLDILKNQNISLGNKFKWIKKQRLYKYSFLYYPIVKFIIYKPFRLRYLHDLFKRASP